MAHSRLRSLIVDARVYLWQLQLGYHQRTDAAGPWLCHDVFSAALVANPSPKLHIHLLSATQLERLRLLPTHLAIVPAPASAGPSLKLTANLARQVIRLGRREGWCPERGGLPVTIAEGLDLLAEAGLVG